MADYSVVFVPGKAYWAKIVGDKALHDNYDKDGKEWSWEFAPDDTSFLKEHRLLGRLKDGSNDEKNPGKGDYLYLKKPELDKDGKKNDPVTVIDSDGSAWDGRLIGNGTSVVAKLTIVNYGGSKQKSIWTTAIRVEDLVPYEGGERTSNDDFSGYDGSKKSSSKKPNKARASAESLAELDDDLTF